MNSHGAPGPVLGILCGLEDEARALGPWRHDPRVMVRLSAGSVDRARAAVGEMLLAGVRGLLSWGLCGGLDPDLRPADLVDCPAKMVFTATEIVATPAEKAAAYAAGARIVDLESAAVAASGLPGRAIRVVLDEAGFALPAAALVALREDGRPDLAGIVLAMLRRPAGLPAMIGLAARYRRALPALGAARDRIGGILDGL